MSAIRPYAGFWKRFAAYLIDGIILSVPMLLLFIPLIVYFVHMAGTLEGADESVKLAAEIRARQLTSVAQLVSFILPMVYFAWMESSKLQATLGKMLLGIKVVDANGQRMTFWHAFGRNAAKIISGIILNIGYFMAGATRKKQALHDQLANAYVVNKDFQPGDDLPEVETHFGILWGVIGAMILLMILFIGLIASLIVYGVQHASAQKTPGPVVQTTQNPSLNLTH